MSAHLACVLNQLSASEYAHPSGCVLEVEAGLVALASGIRPFHEESLLRNTLGRLPGVTRVVVRVA